MSKYDYILQLELMKRTQIIVDSGRSFRRFPTATRRLSESGNSKKLRDSGGPLGFDTTLLNKLFTTCIEKPRRISDTGIWPEIRDRDSRHSDVHYFKTKAV